VRGVTKNFFAAASYSLTLVVVHCLIIFLASVLPFAALAFLHGWARIFAAISIGVAVLFQACIAVVMKSSPLYGFTHPFGALIYIYMVFRSTAVTLWRGGVVWRDTFYSLDELRRGKV
jgi:hypothetical protein